MKRIVVFLACFLVGGLAFSQDGSNRASSAGFADLNGVFSPTNDGGTIPSDFSITITDNLIFDTGKLIVNRSSSSDTGNPVRVTQTPYIFKAEDGALQNMEMLSPFGTVQATANSVHFPRQFTYASGGTLDAPSAIGATQGVFDLRMNAYGTNSAYNTFGQLSTGSIGFTPGGRAYGTMNFSLRRSDDDAATVLVDSDNEIFVLNEDGLGSARFGKNKAETFLINNETQNITIGNGDLDFNKTLAQITPASQLTIIPDSDGSSQSRLVLGKTSAVNTILEDRDPLVPATTSRLLLSHDSQSSMSSAPGTGFRIFSDAASIELAADNVRIDNFNSQATTGTPTFVVGTDATGVLTPIDRGYFNDDITSVNTTQTVVPTGNTTYLVESAGAGQTITIDATNLIEGDEITLWVKGGNSVDFATLGIELFRVVDAADSGTVSITNGSHVYRFNGTNAFYQVSRI